MKTTVAHFILTVLASTSLHFEASAKEGILRVAQNHVTEEEIKEDRLIKIIEDVEKLQDEVVTLREEVMTLKTGKKVLKSEVVDLKRRLDAQPFNCSGDVCTAISKYFLFPKGVLIGKIVAITGMQFCP